MYNYELEFRAGPPRTFVYFDKQLNVYAPGGYYYGLDLTRESFLEIKARLEELNLTGYEV